MPSPTPLLSFVHDIIGFSPRQLDGEIQTAMYLQARLKEHRIPFTLQRFTTTIPVAQSAVLNADGKRVSCEACCMASGDISGKDVLVSASMPSSYFQDKPNISFNPSCPVISPGNHYYAPAVAVSHEALRVILQAKRVKGSVRVKAVKHRTANILVGNTTNPRTICFAHYDSVKTGAIDNASGVAVLLGLILRHPEVLQNTLCVFSANEELSYDRPFYWGRGFRALQKKRPDLFRRAQSLLVVDCVGNGPASVTRDPAIVPRAFPIDDMPRMKSKIALVVGDIDHLMTVYHSALDDGRGMTERHMEHALKLVKAECSGR